MRFILKRTKIPFVAQLGSMDCGAACLAMLFNYYGCKVDIVDISTYIHIGRDGMSLSIMKETAEKYGLGFPLINIPMSKRTWTVCFRSFYATTVITLWLKESGGMENTPSLIQQKGEAWWISLNLRIYIGIF